VPDAPTTATEELAALKAAPRRHPALHWTAFAAAVVSLLLLVLWMTGGRGPVSEDVALLDLVLSAFFAAEFFTRSGFRWARLAYVGSRFFDFVAMVPALVLVTRGLPYEDVWVWLVLAARVTRAVDRVLGDGFVKRNALALLEAFEEELTDRVTLRLLARAEADLTQGRFGQAVAQALARNRDPMLARVRAAAMPPEGAAADLAHIAGLDKVLLRAEERAFDAVVEIIGSEEVDRAVQDVIRSTFGNLRRQVGTKSWRQRIGRARAP
jgi:hypothetical protein